MTTLFATASVAAQVAAHAAQSWPWYVVRGAGLLAAALIITLIFSGIGLVTGYTFRFLEPIKAWAVHRALGIALGMSVAVHIVFLLLDKFVSFNLLTILVPFTSSIWVTLGILAAYALALVIGTSLLIIDRSHRLWRLIHFAAYFALGAVFLHALFLGTDLAHGRARLLWLLAGAVLIIGVLYRLYHAGTLKRPK